MSNEINFILRLKDMLSGVMWGAARNTGQAANRINSGMNSIAQSAKMASLSGVRSISTLERYLKALERKRNLSIDTSQFNQQIARVKKEIDRLKNDGLDDNAAKKRGIFPLVRNIAAGLGVTALIAGAGSIAGMGMQADAQRTSFETMAGKQDGNKLFGDLTKFANDSIFGKEVYQNAQTMLAFGGTAKEIMPDLKMLGDVSMGNKERLGSLSLAFAQIHATGRLMGQDLLQLVNAGFNPLQIISEKTGISMADLKVKMENGQISFENVRKAFQDATGPAGKFFEMTDKIAQTPFGKWEALKGQISGIGVEFGTALLPIASSLMDAIKPFVDMLPGIIKKVMPSIQGFVKDLMPTLKTLGDVLTTVIPGGFRLIANSAGLALKILRPFIWFVGKIAESLGRMFDGMADAIPFQAKKVEDATGNMMDGVASTIADSKDSVVGAMSSVINGSEMDSLFAEAGKRHGALYAQDLQDQVNSIKLTLPQQQVLASWATSNGKFVSKPGSADPYGDYLEQKRTPGEVLDQLPAMLRATGLNKGRDAFDKLANLYLNAKASPFISASDAAAIRKGAVSIVEEQRKYIIKLANGDVKPEANGGYEFLKGKGKKGSGASASGITSGGPRQVTININKEMIGQLSIISQNIKEGVGDLEKLIEEAIYRVFYSLESEQ